MLQLLIKNGIFPLNVQCLFELNCGEKGKSDRKIPIGVYITDGLKKFISALTWARRNATGSCEVVVSSLETRRTWTEAFKEFYWNLFSRGAYKWRNS